MSEDHEEGVNVKYATLMARNSRLGGPGGCLAGGQDKVASGFAFDQSGDHRRSLKPFLHSFSLL